MFQELVETTELEAIQTFVCSCFPVLSGAAPCQIKIAQSSAAQGIPGLEQLAPLWHRVST